MLSHRLLSFYRCTSNLYNLNEESFEVYERHLQLLSEEVQFWPPVGQVRAAANKWQTSRHLQLLAKDFSRYAPATRLLRPGDEIHKTDVLKRSHSDCGLHVIFPSAPSSHRTWDYLNSKINPGTDEFWMAQEFVPSLACIGEWRVFIVGGTIISVMHTFKQGNGKWLGTAVEKYMTMEEIGYVSLYSNTTRH